MGVYISVEDAETDILYGLLVGWNCRRLTEQGVIPYKDWAIHIYYSEKSRRLGMKYQKREYVDCDFLTFEIKVIDLFNMAKLATVIPKDRSYVDEDVMRFIKSKGKDRG